MGAEPGAPGYQMPLNTRGGQAWTWQTKNKLGMTCSYSLWWSSFCKLEKVKVKSLTHAKSSGYEFYQLKPVLPTLGIKTEFLQKNHVKILEVFPNSGKNAKIDCGVYVDLCFCIVGNTDLTLLKVVYTHFQFRSKWFKPTIAIIMLI